jgi:predicted TIM-barrel fold metal-dependent hydrolase
LISLGAFGGSTALSVVSALAQPAKSRLIDVHHHIVPQFYFDAVKDRMSGIPGWFGWTPQKALAAMDESGVATAITSYTTPGAWLGDIQRSRRLARQCNEYAARLTQDYPGRFGFFAAVPLPDIDGSLQEIDYALDTLKADGVGLMTSYDNQWLGDSVFAQVFQELNRRKAIVYVHPTAPSCCGNLMSYVPPFVTEFVQDINRAITSLVYSGSLAGLREIRFIFSLAGGTMPMLAGRIAQLESLPQLAGKVPNGIQYELKRFYYEIAGSANRPAFAALTSLIPTSQIMFGSDYPFWLIPATAVGLSTVGLSRTDRTAIERSNAITLFSRFKRG